MSFLSKKDVLASIKTRVQDVHGVKYTIYEAYFGTNPLTKKPVRKYAKSESRLKDIIKDFFVSLDHGGAVAAMLSPHQAYDAQMAFEKLNAAGISMTLQECVEKLLAGECVGQTQTSSAISLGEAYDKYKESIIDKSESYRKDIRIRVGSWVDATGQDTSLSSITAASIKKYLMDGYYRQGDVGSWVTYNNCLGNIKTFLRWCANAEQGMMATDPAENMKKIPLPYRQPKYMKAADVKKLFDMLWIQRNTPAKSTDLAYAILSFFCGMRISEIERARLGESAIRINLTEKFIRVELPKGVSKGIRPRAFVIPDQALEWMKSFDFLEAVRRKNAKYRRHLVSVALAAGVALPKNVGRHTFITMFEAVHHDSNALTAIVGNTDDVRARSYNGVELAPEGRAYFAIMPPTTTAESV